jgi:uracil phosphoribosyltransferase
VVVEVLGVCEGLVADVCAVVPVAEVSAIGLQRGGTLQATVSTTV